MPSGGNFRSPPLAPQARYRAGGLPLRASFGLILAPALLGLVVLGGSAVASGHIYGETVVAAVALLFVLVLGSIGAKALLDAVTRVRDAALSAANHDLPADVERLREPRELGDRSPEQVVRSAPDVVEVSVHDELGQVAYAINSIYKEALRGAARQAVLRGDVDTMVLSLARRSQSLVDKMAGVLAEIEQAETDPERLGRLFELDRLGARMRRNDENMLVLANAYVSPPRDQYMLLRKIVEAAQAEIELHHRVDYGTVDSDVAISAVGAGDVIRLVAELIDNATRFSPPTTAVLVDGRRIGDYVLIEIEDRGLGMSEAQLAAYNDRLAAPPAADVADCRMMGLAVVGRLAERHGIRVTMRANSDSGTVVSVTLPTALLVLPTRAERALPRPRMAPELPPAAPPGWPLAAPSAGRGMSDLLGTAAAAALGAGAQAAAALGPGGVRALTAGSGNGRAGHAPSPPGRVNSGHPPNHLAPSHASESTALSRVRAVPRHSEVGHALALPAAPVSESSPAESTPANGGPPAGGDASRADSGTMGAVAGRAPLALPGWDALGERPDPALTPPDSAEPSIFREMEALWFGAESDGEWIRPPDADEYGWRSAGDDGWQAAAVAAAPPVTGTTESGLPRRTPAAQLVPGAVAGFGGDPFASRRNPDDVRGVLTAYHRGVQRGRGGGEAQSAGHPRLANEETH